MVHHITTYRGLHPSPIWRQSWPYTERLLPLFYPVIAVTAGKSWRTMWYIIDWCRSNWRSNWRWWEPWITVPVYWNSFPPYGNDDCWATMIQLTIHSNFIGIMLTIFEIDSICTRTTIRQIGLKCTRVLTGNPDLIYIIFLYYFQHLTNREVVQSKNTRRKKLNSS